MILYSNWRKLPLSTRVLISKQFGIAKTGATHVSNNQILDDGYKIEDVESALNLEAMKAYAGVEQTDLGTLFELVVAKIEGREDIAKQFYDDQMGKDLPKLEPIEGTVRVEVPVSVAKNWVGSKGDAADVVPAKPKRKYTKKSK